MRILIQEAKDAKVIIDNKIVGSIDKGEVLLVSFTNSDTNEVIDKMIDKLLKLRIFADENKNTNITLSQFGGKILAVSQFTLYASLNKGNRPSFEHCLAKEKAIVLYDYFVEKLKEKLPESQFGVFHADMLVNFTNVGPFTIWMDSKELGFEVD